MQIDPNELAIGFGGKGAAPAAVGSGERPRVEPKDQKLKDAEIRAILESELAKKIAWFEENNRLPTPEGKKKADEFKAQLARTEADIAGLKRELGRMGPAPEALPAVAAEAGAAPAEKTTVGDIDPSELGGSYPDPEPKSDEYAFWTPERMAAAFGGGAGALFGNPLKGDPGSMAARLAERVMGAPSGSVQDIYGAQNPMDPRSVSRQIAEGNVPPLQQGPLPTTAPAVGSTSGERWAAKTGYGMGTGDVQDVSSRYQRAVSKGKISGKLDKLYGPKLPGEPASLVDRMLLRAQQAEAARVAAAQAEQNRPTVEEAQRREFQRAQQERNRAVNQMDQSQRRAKALYDVQTGAVGKGVNVLSGAMGARDLYSGMTSMFPKDEATGEYGYAPNSSNIPQTAGGAAAIYALRNPYIGLPVAGAAQTYGAGRDIYSEGKVTPETGTRAISGLGVMAMARNPITGLLMQIPAGYNALLELAKENPEWLKAAIGTGAFDPVPGQ
jgi:hypothetical protein